MIIFQYDGRVHVGRSRQSCGGVGRNVADALIKLGLKNTRLISVIGNDEPGKIILESLGDGGKTVKYMPKVNTARYELQLSLADNLLLNGSIRWKHGPTVFH